MISCLLRRAYGGMSSGDVKRKEFIRSRLFKVTGRFIGILMIYGSTGGDGNGDILTVVFM